MGDTVTTTTQVTFLLGLESVPWQTPPQVTMRLQWTARDPYRVHMMFARVPWVVGRDVLTAGMEGPSGLGDVTVLPDFDDPQCVELVIASPSGRAVFRVSRSVLRSFLTSTEVLVPSGSESLPFSDRSLQRLINAGGL